MQDNVTQADEIRAAIDALVAANPYKEYLGEWAKSHFSLVRGALWQSHNALTSTSPSQPEAVQALVEALEAAMPFAAGYAVLREAIRAGGDVQDWVRISPQEASEISRAFIQIAARNRKALAAYREAQP